MPSSSSTAELPENETVFELPGDLRPTTYMWVQTCENLKCSCREAAVVVTDTSREAAIEQGGILRDRLKGGLPDSRAAVALAAHAEHFFLRIDSGKVYWAFGDKVQDVHDRPRIARVMRHVDGEVLEEIGRLWCRGKGLMEPAQMVLQIVQAKAPVLDWTPGELLSWDVMQLGARQDIYTVGDRHYQALERYCPTADCPRDEVAIQFKSTSQGWITGGVVIDVSSGDMELRVDLRADRPRLRQLWAVYQERNPRYLTRFRKRCALVKQVCERFELPNGDPLRGCAGMHY